MVGGQKKDNGLAISNNIFSALGRRKSKRSDKGKDKSDKAAESKKVEEPPKQIWTPAPVTVKAWGDVEDDDDDYYETTAPLESIHKPDPNQAESLSQGEESEVDEYIEDEPEEEEAENEATDGDAVHEEAPAKNFAPSLPVVREPDRHLSKKEQKKKEMQDLEALLADFGSGGLTEPGTEPEPVVVAPVTDNVTTENVSIANGEAESKKKKKPKKEKSFNKQETDAGPSKEASDEFLASAENGQESATLEDPREVIKKLASKKKKPGASSSSDPIKTVAAEASIRKQKLAQMKKKEKQKQHYNQQPAR